MARYGYAILSVITALAAALVLRSFDLEGFIFVIAVAVAVWFGGRGPGVLAVLLSIVVLHFVFIAPLDTGAMLPTYAYFTVFSVLAVLITVLSEARHRAEQSLLQARNELEVKVQERTAELERSNLQLREEIAERRRTEEELRRSEAFLAEGQRLTRTGSWSLRAAERTMRWSRELYNLMGHAPGTAPLAIDEIWHLYHPEDRRRVQQTMETAFRDRADFELGCRIVLPDGTLRHIEIIGHAVVDAAADLVEYVGTTMDVTERRQAEEALRNAQAELEHVTRVTTLGEVTASFAHEVNQPLAAIVNNANACLGLLPEDRGDLGEVRAALADIVGDADRASAIIERVRNLAKRSAAEKVSLHLARIVEDVVALAATESAARRVAIRVGVPADLPPVCGDRVQLQQVLLNLVVNGMDAMSAVDEEERVLEIRGRVELEQGNRAATISVQDRGVGLQAVQRQRLFEAFYTTKPHGMGMGLAISRSIIEAHGGHLWAEANRGAGATFSFSLPAAAEAESA